MMRMSCVGGGYFDDEYIIERLCMRVNGQCAEMASLDGEVLGDVMLPTPRETIDEYIERIKPTTSVDEVYVCLLYYNSRLKYPASIEKVVECVKVAKIIIEEITKQEAFEAYDLDLRSLAREAIKKMYLYGQAFRYKRHDANDVSWILRVV